MNMHTILPEPSPANPIVAAYLAARANDRRYEEQDQHDTIEVRAAQFAEGGGRHYAMAWGITDAEHAALVALLTADRLTNLIDGYSRCNDRRQKVLTIGAEEAYELMQIKHALVNLWRFLDPAPTRKLQPLAQDMGLVNANGHTED